MTENEFLERILERLGNAEGVEEIFGLDEVLSWSSEAADLFLKNELLRSSNPAKTIECKGCEQYCVMPVDVRLAENKQPTIAFIAYDKREDIGRVPVEMNRLKQWKLSATFLAKKISSILNFEKAPIEKNRGRNWVLGNLKGNKHKGQVLLSIEKGVTLKVSNHEIPLIDVLTVKEGRLILDKKELLNLVDKPATSVNVSKYQSSVIRRESKKLETQKVYDAWQKAFRELKRNRPDMSNVWYSIQIAKSSVSNGRDSETIRRHIKK